MARRKVKLAFIVNDSKRKATFKKRRNGLMKKVHELSTLCGVKACAIVYSPYEKHADVYPDPAGAQSVIEEFRRLPEMEQAKKMHDIESFMRERVTRAKEQLSKQAIENREMDVTMLLSECIAGRRGLQGLTMMDLNDADYVLSRNLNEVKMLIEAKKASAAQEGGSGGAAPENGGLLPENAGLLPENAGLLPGNAGLLPGNAGLLPENAGLLPGNAGLLPGNAGLLPGNAGLLPGNAGLLPGNAGLLPGNAGLLPGNAGLLPGNAGLLPGNAGLLPGNVGLLPGNVGLLPQNVGFLPQNAGLLPQNVGFLPQNVGLQEETHGLQEETHGLNVDAGEDQQRPQWFTDWMNAANEQTGAGGGNDMMMPLNNANNNGNVWNEKFFP